MAICPSSRASDAPKTKMHALPERQMPVGIAPEIEPIRLVELALVAVGRPERGEYEPAAWNGHSGESSHPRARIVRSPVARASRNATALRRPA